MCIYIIDSLYIISFYISTSTLIHTYIYTKYIIRTLIYTFYLCMAQNSRTPIFAGSKLAPFFSQELCLDTA